VLLLSTSPRDKRFTDPQTLSARCSVGIGPTVTCHDGATATSQVESESPASPHATPTPQRSRGYHALNCYKMIQSTRQWLRRNRTNFAVGAGVLGAGYLAGQYVLGKLSEARQRMGEERIAKEKYAATRYVAPDMTATNATTACDGALNRTRKTAPSPSSPSSRLPPKTFSTPFPSSRSSKSCSAKRLSACRAVWGRARLALQRLPVWQTRPMMTRRALAYRQTATYTPARSP
jgi:hypothetical protein